MQFYSTNNKNTRVSLQQAVTQGLAPDNGLYMPERIPPLPAAFFRELKTMSFRDIAFAVAENIIGDDIPAAELRKIVDHTIQFDAPVVEVDNYIYALELFHGPTLAFKDFGARFMSQLLGYFAKQQSKDIVILAATSGDTGSAVANGFLGVPGTKVIVLYPSGKVSEIQEKQFTTLGQNVTALEVNGTFDDCQALVKQAFLDNQLKDSFFLTSANSINIARLIPQSFYYFYAYGQVADKQKPVVFSVPSGNFGNVTGGLLAQRMGLPVDRFIVTTNINDVVPAYLQSQVFTPRPSQQTISNAMDVGNPSNFVRMLDLFDHDFTSLSKHVVGYSCTDDETRAAMRHTHAASGYTLDPHGAVGYLGLKKYLADTGQDVTGIFLETAHPAKFKEVVDETLDKSIEIPAPLQVFMKRAKQSVALEKDYTGFKDYLLKNLK
jgi:threonine synthase